MKAKRNISEDIINEEDDMIFFFFFFGKDVGYYINVSVTDFDDGGDLLGSVCLGVSKYLQPITRLVRRKRS